MKHEDNKAFQNERARMVHDQIRARGINDERVLAAMELVPRHIFVSSADEAGAYDDNPLPIGFSQTISQPYIVALMTEALRIESSYRVLEIGTGSGYQTAVLSRLAAQVYTVESVEALSMEATQRLAHLGYDNVDIRHGDGYEGWPEEAPFDGIVVTAAPPSVPSVLVDQLRVGGRLIIPVGVNRQKLLQIEKADDGMKQEKLCDVRFVPMLRRRSG